MTTEIIVNAHCGSDKKVKIKITGQSPEEITLNDGETNTSYAYDDQEVSVKEVENNKA